MDKKGTKFSVVLLSGDDYGWITWEPLFRYVTVRGEIRVDKMDTAFQVVDFLGMTGGR